MSVLKQIYKRGADVSPSYCFYSLLANLDMKAHDLQGIPYHRSIYEKRDNAILEVLYKRFKPQIDKWKDAVETAIPFDEPEKAPIWICWLQGEDDMPPIVKLCYERLCKNAGEHPVILLTNDSIPTYVSIDKKITKLYEQGSISAAHYTDVLRANLLATYGGLWIDSTVLVTKPLPTEVFEKTIWSIVGRDSDFEYLDICFAASEWAGYFQAAMKNSTLQRFIVDMWNAYFNQYDYVFEYLLVAYFSYIGRNSIGIVKSEYENIPLNNTKVESLWPILQQNTSFNAMDAKTLLKGNTYLYKLSYKAAYANDAEKIDRLRFVLEEIDK